MTHTGHMPIQMHAAAEFAFGVLLVAAAFALGLGATAIGIAILAGILLVTLALGATEPGGRGSIPVSAHATYDWAIGFGMVAAGIVFAFAGNLGAFGLFAVGGAIELLLASRTRYSAAAR
ncbi:MAG TPA: hypothetical protein VF752_02005 [Thermoleophilaceae bacterium]